jgi:HSP20 family molecular chaperone IbpA
MVKVQAKAEDRDYSFEKEFNSFTTTLDPSQVTANFNNGVLDITIKKAEESKGKKIAIK